MKVAIAVYDEISSYENMTDEYEFPGRGAITILP